MIGQVVDSRYEIVELLGQGGMGSVYEAQDVETGRRVALKLVSAEIIAKSAVLAARFQREAKASAAVVSEHIVQVLDAGLDAPSGQPYMVMELLRGENVRTLLRRVGALPPQLAVRIGVQTCMGLHKAHEGGVVHRDIKPANLFLTQGEGNRLVVKLLDFGVAKVKMDQVDGADAEALTRTGSLLGSPLYMSPEQARGLKTIDHRADLWSLGVVLYQLLSRRAPLEGIESLGGLIVSICSDEPAPLRQHAPWVPPKLAEVVHGALKLDPARRFQTAAQMLDALRGCLVGTPEIHSGMLVGLSEQQRTAMAAQHESGAPGEGGQAATIALDGSADLIVLEPGAAAAAAEPAAGRDGTVVLAEPALPAPARAGAGQAASDRAGIPGALEETQHRGPLPQLRPAWSPGGGTGGRLALALLVGAVVGVAGVWGFNTVFPPAEAGTPSAQARPTGAPLPARTAATTTATATQSPATAAVETAAAEPAALKVLGKPQTAGLPPAGAAPAATPPPAAPPATAAAPAATPPPAAKPAPAAPPPAPPPASKPAPVAPPPAPKPAPKPASKPASGDDYE